jgi:hypothetical protein
LPPGFVPPILGTDARVEVDGHYAHTNASQSQTTAVGTFGVYPELLGGTVANNGWLCGTSTFSCPTTSALTAQFTAWQLTAKAESDFHLGTITVTPSVALIGGEGDNNEGLRQNLTQLDSGAPNGNFQDYSATVKLHWRDIGGKVSLNGGVPVTPWLSLSLGGSVGVVDRDAHLSGNDFFNSNVPLTAPQTNPLASSVSGSDNTAAFMSTFEASVNVTPLPGLLFRGFAGLNVDSGIPGVTTPSYTGSEALSPATIISVPAKVKFSSETALYIGGGAVVRF